MTSTMSTSATSGMTTTATTAAAAATSTAMHMEGMGGSCKISMLWNWYTIDACFLSQSWRIRNNGMFAVSCIGVALLTVSLELFRRLSKEYDFVIQRKFQQAVLSRSAEFQKASAADALLNRPRYITSRVTPLQQLIRAILHAITFGIAYIIMLLAMYYNGYIIISIFVGAGLGKFVCDWMTLQASIDIADDNSSPVRVCDDPTVCCG